MGSVSLDLAALKEASIQPSDHGDALDVVRDRTILEACSQSYIGAFRVDADLMAAENVTVPCLKDDHVLEMKTVLPGILKGDPLEKDVKQWRLTAVAVENKDGGWTWAGAPTVDEEVPHGEVVGGIVERLGGVTGDLEEVKSRVRYGGAEARDVPLTANDDVGLSEKDRGRDIPGAWRNVDLTAEVRQGVNGSLQVRKVAKIQPWWRGLATANGIDVEPRLKEREWPEGCRDEGPRRR